MLVRPKVKRVHVGGVKQERGERRDAFLSFFLLFTSFLAAGLVGPKKGASGGWEGGLKVAGQRH